MADWWKANRATVVIPVCVLPEVAYLLHTRIGPDAEEAFIRSVADDEFAVEPLEPDDVERAADIMRLYADLGLGFVDATVIATAERLDSRDVLTSDRRHFSVVRPSHARSFVLLP